MLHFSPIGIHGFIVPTKVSNELELHSPHSLNNTSSCRLTRCMSVDKHVHPFGQLGQSWIACVRLLICTFSLLIACSNRIFMLSGLYGLVAFTTAAFSGDRRGFILRRIFYWDRALVHAYHTDGSGDDFTTAIDSHTYSTYIPRHLTKNPFSRVAWLGPRRFPPS